MRWRFAACTPLVWTLRTARRVPLWLRVPDDVLRQAKSETWSRVSAAAIAARARAIAGVEIQPALARWSGPALNVGYAGDRVVPNASSEEIHAYCRHAARLLLPGDHLGVFHPPQPLATAVTDFIARIHIPSSLPRQGTDTRESAVLSSTY